MRIYYGGSLSLSSRFPLIAGIPRSPEVKTDEENIEKLKALSKLSPVLDVTTHGTKVDVTIERNEYRERRAWMKKSQQVIF